MLFAAITLSLIALLTFYASGYYVVIFAFLRARSELHAPAAFEASRSLADRVVALIPARNEGPQILRAIRSLLGQDHAGEIDVVVLLEDASDTSLPFLAEAFSAAVIGETSRGAPVELYRDERRSVRLVFTGVSAKSEKINSVSAGLSAPYAAILDADHEADPAWIRTSLALLKKSRGSIIQGRRGPLSAAGFLRLWDSLHQHIGCEMLNVAFTRLGLTVFFTGTTTVMETRLLREHPLRACLTEDADFSYQVIVQGGRILHNPWHGSNEEVAPDLYSFIARRRRWANGHTGAFFRHLAQAFRSPLNWKERLQFVFHGMHYLAALPVAALHVTFAAYFLTHFSPVHTAAALVAALFLSRLILASQGALAWRARLLVGGVTLAWVFPVVVIVLNLILAAFARDPLRAALPLPGALHLIGLACFLAPLMLLLVGLAGYRQLSPATFLAATLTYPAAFFLDIVGVLIGLADLVAGHERWRPVTRVIRADEPARDIRTSWAFARLPGAVFSIWPRRKTRFMDASGESSGQSADAQGAFRDQPGARRSAGPRLAAALAIAALCFVIAAIFYTPADPIPLANHACVAREHDDFPWIIPPRKLSGYCNDANRAASAQALQGGRRGVFHLTRSDPLHNLDGVFWDQLDDTFFCNLAHFRPANVVANADGQNGLQLVLRRENAGDRQFTAGSIATKNDANARYRYGRFEVVMKPARLSGVVTAFFLYRFDPWQEIDTEFLGNDTTKLLLNVYYNPGEVGDRYNYGYRGTPVVIDLGFDAAADYHEYALEWDPEEIRWFVDGRLVHRRRAGRPTPIPHLPMRFHVNLWPTCSAELAGEFRPAADSLPASASVRSVKIYEHRQAAFPRYSQLIDSVLGRADSATGTWRDEAEWMQPAESR